ncbi:MAG TPA: nuclear transport factor 2 family protein [Aldersonia sp.]
MQRSGELEALVIDWFAAASRGDDTLVRTRFSEDAGVRLIGSDEVEWIEGTAGIVEFLCGEVAGAAGQVGFEPTDVAAFASDSMGWASARLEISFPDGNVVKPRWTAVFQNEGGVWRFVHIHASIPIANEEAGWIYDED